jgi:hypothetical protein
VRLLVRYHLVENLESQEGKRCLDGLVLEGENIALYFFKSPNLILRPVGAKQRGRNACHDVVLMVEVILAFLSNVSVRQTLYEHKGYEHLTERSEGAE